MLNHSEIYNLKSIILPCMLQQLPFHMLESTLMFKYQLSEHVSRNGHIF